MPRTADQKETEIMLNANAATGRLNSGQTTRAISRDIMGLLSFPAAVIQVERDAEIVAQGGAQHHCLQVLEGCLRIVCLLEDGRRQISEFLFPGDVLGLDLVPGEAFGAEAVTRVVLRRIPHALIESRASSDFGFVCKLRAYGAAQVRAARNRCILLGRKTATERVASFLLEMHDRCPSARPAVDLPMSRADIADYLGLTAETVCRALADLRQRNTVRVERSRIVILDRVGLELAGSEYIH